MLLRQKKSTELARGVVQSRECKEMEQNQFKSCNHNNVLPKNIAQEKKYKNAQTTKNGKYSSKQKQMH